ncbi:hypothetical protein HPP92_005748 [Vanilla planifolia]|uniref:Homeobox domain-containing protein n=1 Tax=Vanilla planifolia TaxID=51239 RepID=A0A835VBN7_VANPL|nr:hypothetical protein HPP92_005748 [Vanilla planifolia]
MNHGREQCQVVSISRCNKKVGSFSSLFTEESSQPGRKAGEAVLPPSAVSSFSTTNANPGGGGRPEADSERAPSRASDEDDDAVAARKKLRLTKEQSALLEDRFKEHSTLNPKQKQSLAKQLNLRPRQVEVWFQNRRARTKLKQTEMDCEYLKKCCDALTEENRRLQRELHDLRALKFTTSASQPLPLFMQLPAPALTLCPSCERISGDGAGFVRGSKPQPPPPPPPPSAPHFFNPFAHSAAWLILDFVSPVSWLLGHGSWFAYVCLVAVEIIKDGVERVCDDEVNAYMIEEMRKGRGTEKLAIEILESSEKKKRVDDEESYTEKGE